MKSLRRLLIGASRLLIGASIIVGGFFTIEFVYPVKLAEWALASLNKDQPISDVLSDDSKFVSYLHGWSSPLLKMIGSHVWFRSGNSKNWEKNDTVCGSINMHLPNLNTQVQFFSSYESDAKNLIWSGDHKELKKILTQYQEQLGKCSVMETTFMPFWPLRCTVSVVYDRDLKVQSWEEPPCWD